VSTCARLRWLLRANLIPPLLLSVKREGAERGLCNWERIERKRIERHALARIPANPSLLRSNKELSALLLRLAREHRGLVVRLRFVWLSSLPPARLLPPALLRPFDRVVRLELELEMSKPHGKEVQPWLEGLAEPVQKGQ